MTTAFANLTDGRPIMEAPNVWSYLSFFALVWWVWASQVAYNVRFRQSDWLHRAFIFFQVFVFCALATFTSDFDITNGISDQRKADQQVEHFEQADPFNSVTKPSQDVQKFRENRLPTLNLRGIAMTMAWSRLLLLVQYLVVFLHSRRTGETGTRIPLYDRTALLVHIGSLLFSSICFFISFGVIGSHPGKGDQIAKLVLWYFPILIEVAAHYLSISHFCRGCVQYNATAIIKRSATVFIIILGGGLDKITIGFKVVIGNVSFSWKGLGLIVCGVITFLLLFSLFFSTRELEASEPDRISSRRAISLFFFQFVYLAAIIVTLQGIATVLRASNLGNALETSLDFLRQSKTIMDIKGFSQHLNESDYSFNNVQYELKKQGVALEDLLPFVNEWMDIAAGKMDTAAGEDLSGDPDRFKYPYGALLQMEIYAVWTVLDLFHSENFPIQDLLIAELDAFYNNDPNNLTWVNNATFSDIMEEVFISNATPALWFYGAGGSVLVALGLMGIIKQWPKFGDWCERGQIISRLLTGSTIILLTAVDVNSSASVFHIDDLHYESSRIWELAIHSWV
ncbi:hypothetical protein D9758_017258 [Tetrapyrgos nigripes]|uniref:Uncharacterized protein n=1 Tax=Tetrapyrgos nigripes TaxID=182062 RepID=A0A8H5FGE3_9AGAR|nr:hypothetical protein D9758_017258 [Tetrapyrgos nigripes]